MSRLSDLKSTATLSDFAELLGFTPSGLSYVLFKLPTAAKYKTFEIPKRNGGTRIIKAPVDALKNAQRKLSTLLQDCAAEINIAKGRKDLIAHGFKRERSIITNAREHRSRRYVFNLDLEDFFPSINFGRVRGFFIRDKSFALNVSVATVIAQIACHDNALPQGSPCSPVISNLIAHVLDIHLVGLASRSGCTYSRYADDLTFSTNQKTFPDEIAKPSATDLHSWVPGGTLRSIVKHSGFKINAIKTHMQYRDSRQEVTGLVVNRRINVRPEYRHTVRAMVHRLLKTGSFEIYTATTTAGNRALEKKPGRPNQLHGMLAFIDQIDLEHSKRPKELKEPLKLTSKELMYQRFLLYVNFFAAQSPVIICEGETDNVYLTHAIRSLAGSYPQLATIQPDGKIKINIRLYKYRKSSTGRILELGDGGSSRLSNFITTYKRETAKFTGPGQEHPVIVLYDNDSGAKSIQGAIKGALGNKATAMAPYVKVFRNLYAMPTPPANGATDSKIEDFFDPAVTATVLNRKTFSSENKFDVTQHYGKKIFAYSVVRQNANSINFGGFHQILTNLTSIIGAHAALMVTATPAVATATN
jgi:hypothetical protein